MSVDAQKLQEVPTYVSSLWSTVVTFIVCVGVLWQTVGVAVLSGMLMLVILVPFNGFYIGNRIRLSQVVAMIFTVYIFHWRQLYILRQINKYYLGCVCVHLDGLIII